jgi:hypothetical protein
MSATEDELDALGTLSLESPPERESETDTETGRHNVDLVLDARAEPVPLYVDDAPLEAGHDGDDLGQLTAVKFGAGSEERLLTLLAPSDLVQSSHGFLIRDIGDASETNWAKSCELCGEPLKPPANEWVCEVASDPGTPEWADCQCNWCFYRRLWERGEYRPHGGRPAKRCGTQECKRKAARARAKGGHVTETPLRVAG